MHICFLLQYQFYFCCWNNFYSNFKLPCPEHIFCNCIVAQHLQVIVARGDMNSIRAICQLYWRPLQNYGARLGKLKWNSFSYQIGSWLGGAGRIQPLNIQNPANSGIKAVFCKIDSYLRYNSKQDQGFPYVLLFPSILHKCM